MPSLITFILNMPLLKVTSPSPHGTLTIEGRPCRYILVDVVVAQTVHSLKGNKTGLSQPALVSGF